MQPNVKKDVPTLKLPLKKSYLERTKHCAAVHNAAQQEERRSKSGFSDFNVLPKDLCTLESDTDKVTSAL